MKPTPPPGKWRHEIVRIHGRRSSAKNAQTELERKLRESEETEDEQLRPIR